MRNPSDALSQEQLDAILAFLPMLERPGFVAGTWGGGAGQLPSWQPSAEAAAFLETLRATGFLVVFDWVAWADEARRLTDGGAAALAEADLPTLRRLLSAYIRAERFVEGTLAARFADGQIVAVLRRLAAIRVALDAA